jgi:hypothetical protein
MATTYKWVQPTGPVYTEGYAGPNLAANVVGDVTPGTPGTVTRTVATRVYNTDGLPGDDGWNFQSTQITITMPEPTAL